MKKEEVLRAVKHGIDERWKYHMESNNSIAASCYLYGVFGGTCKKCPLRIASVGCNIGTPYHKWTETGIGTVEEKEYAAQMYLLLCAIYFELKENWQGYLNSVKEDV